VYRGFYYRNYAMIFRYDPQGNQVLVSDVQISDYVSSQNYYNIYRSSYSTVSSSAGTEAVRLRRGDYAWTTSFLGLNNFYRNTYGESDSRKDQTYSLIDGLDEETWTIIEPFDVVIGVSTPLEAPTPSISDTLGVSPLEVAPPDTTTPDVGGDVTPPATTGETTETAAPTQEAATDPAAQSIDPNTPLPAITAIPGVGEDGTTTPVPNTDGLVPPVPGQGDTNTQDLGTLPGLGTLPNPTDPNQLPPATDEAIPLETPENTLPESLSGTSAADVTLPTDALPSTGEITPPTGVTPPPVGATPSDSPLEVTIPEGLNPTVPPIEAGASPLEVAPPEGWSPNQDIDIGVFGTSEATSYTNKQYAADLEELRRQLEEAQKNIEEQQKAIEEFIKSQLTKILTAASEAGHGDIWQDTLDTLTFARDNMSPDMFVRFAGDIGALVGAAYRNPGWDSLKGYPLSGVQVDARENLKLLGDISRLGKESLNPQLVDDLFMSAIPYEYWNAKNSQNLQAMNLTLQMAYTTIQEGMVPLMAGRLPRGKSIVGVGQQLDNAATKAVGAADDVALNQARNSLTDLIEMRKLAWDPAAKKWRMDEVLAASRFSQQTGIKLERGAAFDFKNGNTSYEFKFTSPRNLTYFNYDQATTSLAEQLKVKPGATFVIDFRYIPSNEISRLEQFIDGQSGYNFIKLR
jgi:hypothetical protein